MAWIMNVLLSYPTVVYTALLFMALSYWLFVITGLGKHRFAVAGDGLRVDGIVHLLQSLGLSGVPPAVSLTVLIFWGWLVTTVAAIAILPVVPSMNLILEISAGLILLVLALVLAVIFTRYSINPFRKKFAEEKTNNIEKQAQSRPKIVTKKTPVTPKPVKKSAAKQEKIKVANTSPQVGDVCKVISGRVHEKIGEAEWEENGASQRLQVRCSTPVMLRKGDTALITEYDSDQNFYWVEPYQDPFA